MSQEPPPLWPACLFLTSGTSTSLNVNFQMQRTGYTWLGPVNKCVREIHTWEMLQTHNPGSHCLVFLEIDDSVAGQGRPSVCELVWAASVGSQRLPCGSSLWCVLCSALLLYDSCSVFFSIPNIPGTQLSPHRDSYTRDVHEVSADQSTEDRIYRVLRK